MWFTATFSFQPQYYNLRLTDNVGLEKGVRALRKRVKAGEECIVAVGFEGVYKLVDGREWVFVDSVKLPAIIYFANKLCIASCRVSILYWQPWAQEHYSVSVNFYTVICMRFYRDCSSRLAARLFKIYRIYATPALVVVNREGYALLRVMSAEPVIGLFRGSKLDSILGRL